MKYVMQPEKPEWYESNPDKLYYSATSGSHPRNEWYGFDSRQEALDFISEAFISQSYHDNFEWLDGEIYHQFDMWATAEKPWKNVSPADLSEVIRAESIF